MRFTETETDKNGLVNISDLDRSSDASATFQRIGFYCENNSKKSKENDSKILSASSFNHSVGPLTTSAGRLDRSTSY